MQLVPNLVDENFTNDLWNKKNGILSREQPFQIEMKKIPILPPLLENNDS